MGLWRLERLLGWPEKMLEFHTWYLKEKKWIERTDNGGFAITTAGVDEIEKEGMILGKNLLLPKKTEPGEAEEAIRPLEHISADAAERLEQAIVILEKKLADSPTNLTAWVFLAYLQSSLGHKRREKKAAELVQRIDPFFSIEEFS